MQAPLGLCRSAHTAQLPAQPSEAGPRSSTANLSLAALIYTPWCVGRRRFGSRRVLTQDFRSPRSRRCPAGLSYSWALRSLALKCARRPAPRQSAARQACGLTCVAPAESQAATAGGRGDVARTSLLQRQLAPSASDPTDAAACARASRLERYMPSKLARRSALRRPHSLSLPAPAYLLFIPAPAGTCLPALGATGGRSKLRCCRTLGAERLSARHDAQPPAEPHPGHQECTADEELARFPAPCPTSAGVAPFVSQCMVLRLRSSQRGLSL